MWITGLTSAIFPGAGQLLRGRVGDAVLFLTLALWLHLVMGALAWGIRGDAVWDGLLLGALGFPSGHATPTAVVATVLMFSVHAFAAWDAAVNRPRSSAGDVEHEA